MQTDLASVRWLVCSISDLVHVKFVGSEIDGALDPDNPAIKCLQWTKCIHSIRGKYHYQNSTNLLHATAPGPAMARKS